MKLHKIDLNTREIFKLIYILGIEEHTDLATKLFDSIKFNRELLMPENM